MRRGTYWYQGIPASQKMYPLKERRVLMIIEHKGTTPDISRATYVAPNATVCGDVVLGSDTSVWFSAVIRAECASVTIGDRSNVQDNCTIHTDFDYPVVIGKGVTIGHNAIVHGARVGDDALIGMHATLLNGAVIGRESLIAAGALVKEGDIIPERSLVVGVPGKVVKTLTDEDIERQKINTQFYVDEAKVYTDCKIISE